MKHLSKLFALVLGATLLTACGGSPSNDPSELPEFDRKEFLRHYAEEIIQPAVGELSVQAAALKIAVDALVGQKSPEQLARAREAWDQTYRAWVRVSMLNFGPGGTEGRRRTLSEEVAVFPVSTRGIENKIAAAEFVFDDAKRNTRGFLAVEYLLFNPAASETLLEPFDANRATYLQKTVEHLVGQIERLRGAWEGEYAAAFIANDGTDAQSSTTQLFNEMVRNFEDLRDKKIGIPLGLIAGQSTPQPDLAESPHSGKSLDYLLLNYATVVDLWRGKKPNGEDGPGWEEYLRATEGGAALMDTIDRQFAAIDAIVARIPEDRNLRELAQAREPSLVELHGASQTLTRYLKGDVSSLLGLAITFSTGDGD
ncbi:MAG: imelysin family protein [Bacteroidota bacterium]